MKLRTIFLFILFATNAYALVDVEQDKVLIYKNKEGSTLVNNLNIYDNAELKGSPVFIIEKEKLIMGEKIFSLNSPISCKHLNGNTRNCDESVVPVDFLKPQSRYLYILIAQKNDELAELKNKNKSYYLKLKKTDFKKSDWPEESEWRSILGDKAKIQLKTMIIEKPDLKEMFKTLQVCVKAKDKKCISKYSTDSIQLERQFKYRAIADDPALCKKFFEISGDTYEDDMNYVLNKNNVVDSEVTWKNLDKVFFNLEDSDVQVYLDTTKFLGVDSVSFILKAGNNLKCGNDTELQIKIKEMLNVVTGKKDWKISYFNTYNLKKD